MHHGTKGQKWGQRRYQNSDGTWTEEGKARRRLKTTAQLMKDYPSYEHDHTPGHKRWQLDNDHPDYDKQVKSYSKLMNDVEQKSVDWYRSKPVSENAKKLYKASQEREKAIDDFSVQYLKKNPYPYTYEQTRKDLDEMGSWNPMTRIKAKKRYKEGNALNKPVAENFSKAIDNFTKEYDRKHPNAKNGPSYDEILGVALIDLGYENTKAGREYIRNAVIWD